MIAGINKNYIGGYRASHYILCGNDGYGYIVKFISDATRMNESELCNFKYIRSLQKNNPDLIKKYLQELKKYEVKTKMNQEENSKKTELLNLLNDTEKRIIAEIVKGTDFSEIPQKINISKTTFPNSMSDIYRKTKHIISYGNKIKKSALMGYLFGKCGFIRGEIIIPESTLSSAKPVRPDTVAETEKCLDEPVCEESEKVSEQNAKVLENMLVDLGCNRIIESLEVTCDFLRGKYRGFCEKLGDLLIQSTPQNALESTDYNQAKDYDSAIWVLTCALTELRKCNQGE